MHYFLVGENWYARDEFLRELIAKLGVTPELLTIDTITPVELRANLQAQSLFSERRVVILRQPSDNKELWPELATVLTAASSDVTTIVIEASPDKRTKTYKELAKQLELREFPSWTIRDRNVALEWLDSKAKRNGLFLRPSEARSLLDRVGVNQIDLSLALEKLILAGDASEETINTIIEASPSENIFALFEVALTGDRQRLMAMIDGLRQTEDAYRVFGLLTSQLTQFSALLLSDKTVNETADDLGVKPFVLSKVASLARGYGSTEAKRLISLAAETDLQLKSTTIEPWLLVEQFVQKIALR